MIVIMIDDEKLGEGRRRRSEHDNAINGSIHQPVKICIASRRRHQRRRREALKLPTDNLRSFPNPPTWVAGSKSCLSSVSVADGEVEPREAADGLGLEGGIKKRGATGAAMFVCDE